MQQSYPQSNNVSDMRLAKEIRNLLSIANTDPAGFSSMFPAFSKLCCGNMAVDMTPINALLSNLKALRDKSYLEKEIARKSLLKENILTEVPERNQFQDWISNQPIIRHDEWKLILAQLNDSSRATAKATISNMSMIWNDILKLEKTSFLFHLVRNKFLK